MILSLVSVICLYSSALADPMIASSYKHRIGTRESFHKQELDGVSKHHEQMTMSKVQRNQLNLRGRRNELQQQSKKERELYRRRNLSSKPIDYGGEHPYEMMDRKMRSLTTRSGKRRANSKTNYQSYWYDPSFSMDDFLQDDWHDIDDDYNPELGDLPTQFDPSIEDKFNWDMFRPLRIRIDSGFLMENFQEDMKKNEFIVYHVFPAAVQFWAKALEVFPAKRLFIENCIFAPPEDAVYGRNDADMVIYLTANQSCSGNDSQGHNTKAGEFV